MDDKLKKLIAAVKKENKGRSVQVLPGGGEDAAPWMFKLPDAGFVHTTSDKGVVQSKYDVAYSATDLAEGKGWSTIVNGKAVTVVGMTVSLKHRNSREVMAENRVKAEKSLAAQIKKWGGVTTHSSSKDEKTGKMVKTAIKLDAKFKLTIKQLQQWATIDPNDPTPAIVTNVVTSSQAPFVHPINNFRLYELNAENSKKVVAAIEAVQEKQAGQVGANALGLMQLWLDNGELSEGQAEMVRELIAKAKELEEAKEKADEVKQAVEAKEVTEAVPTTDTDDEEDEEEELSEQGDD